MSSNCEYCGEAVACRVCDKHARSEEHHREVELHEAYKARDTSESKVASLEATNAKLVEDMKLIGGQCITKQYETCATLFPSTKYEWCYPCIAAAALAEARGGSDAS